MARVYSKAYRSDEPAMTSLARVYAGEGSCCLKLQASHAAVARIKHDSLLLVLAAAAAAGAVAITRLDAGEDAVENLMLSTTFCCWCCRRCCWQSRAQSAAAGAVAAGAA